MRKTKVMRALGAVLAITLVGCAELAGIGDASQGAGDPVSPSDDPATETPVTQSAPVSTASSSGGGTQPDSTTTTQTTDAGSDTGTTQPKPKKNLGEDCNQNNECKSDECDDALDICVKKGRTSLGCIKQNVTCVVLDDLCCGNDYCAGSCKACKQAGDSPDPARGSDSCCTGVVGSNGKCR